MQQVALIVHTSKFMGMACAVVQHRVQLCKPESQKCFNVEQDWSSKIPKPGHHTNVTNARKRQPQASPKPNWRWKKGILRTEQKQEESWCSSSSERASTECSNNRIQFWSILLMTNVRAVRRISEHFPYKKNGASEVWCACAFFFISFSFSVCMYVCFCFFSIYLFLLYPILSFLLSFVLPSIENPEVISDITHLRLITFSPYLRYNTPSSYLRYVRIFVC